jgi:hypothetical protein
MQYAKALFRKGKKLTEKRRATLCDEFESYSIIKNYIRSIHKDKLKDDPGSFFFVIDIVLESEKKEELGIGEENLRGNAKRNEFREPRKRTGRFNR